MEIKMKLKKKYTVLAMLHYGKENPDVKMSSIHSKVIKTNDISILEKREIDELSEEFIESTVLQMNWLFLKDIGVVDEEDNRPLEELEQRMKINNLSLNDNYVEFTLFTKNEDIKKWFYNWNGEEQEKNLKEDVFKWYLEIWKEFTFEFMILAAIVGYPYDFEFEIIDFKI